MPTARRKPCVSPAERHQRREEQEHPHRDEDDEHVVPVDRRPIELDGNGEIGEQQHLAVDAPGRHEREIFLQREIGDQPEEDDGDGLVEQDSEREGADHPPPRVGSRHKLGIALARIAPTHEEDHDRREREQRVDAGGEIDDVGGKAEDRGHARPLGLRDDAPRAVEHGERREKQQRREIERAPQPRRDPDAEQHREQSEGEGAVALAERPVIAARRADHRPERARHLGDDAGNHHQHHERRVEAGDQREGEIERGIGDHVAELVQHGAGGARLTMLLRHHPVDGVEGHAQEERHRKQEQRPARGGHQRDPGAMRGTQQQRAERHVVGAQARAHQRIGERAEQSLEARLQIVDCRQASPPPRVKVSRCKAFAGSPPASARTPVMPGLDPGIHDFLARRGQTWMVGQARP